MKVTEIHNIWLIMIYNMPPASARYFSPQTFYFSLVEKLSKVI